MASDDIAYNQFLEFNGQPIYGTPTAIIAENPPLQVRRTFYWGLKGQSEVRGGHGGRSLECTIWLHNRYKSRLAIEQGIYIIRTWTGQNGTLKEYDKYHNYQRVYRGCTFEGFTRTQLGADAGPIYDYARTVDGGWIQAGTLRWYQLNPFEKTIN